MPRKRLEALARKRAKRGVATPMLDNAPLLLSELRFGWDGWTELAISRRYRHDGRPVGIGCEEIAAWLDLNLIDEPWWRHDLYRTIKTIDISWMNLVSSQQADGSRTSSSSKEQSEARR